MIRKIIPLASRNLPKIIKITAFTFSLLAAKNYSKLSQPIKCMGFPSFSHSNVFVEVLPKIIRIQRNGQIVGYAYCFADKLMVSPSHQLSDKKIHKSDSFQYYLGDSKLQMKVKVVGHFQNLTFLESSQSILPILPSKNVQLYSPIHIVQNRSYLSIRDGYYVSNEGGYGIINGKGQVGSLVLSNEGILGIVSHIGRDQDYGFLRVILWKDVHNCFKRMKSTKQGGGVYLGVSAVASAQMPGVSVVRIAPNSPLANHLKMGDVVTKVNNVAVNHPQDLTRLIMFSQNTVVFEVESADKSKRLITMQL